MEKIFMSSGAVLAGLAVGLGAFGAHGLQSLLQANGRVATYETAVQYHFYHALALILIGILLHQQPKSAYVQAAWAILIGLVIFSGSLYILSITNIRWLGAITPLGGVAFLVGWGLLAWGAIS